MSNSNQEKCAVTPIAVVGMSFRGPGDATNTENLLRTVAEGRECRSKIPKSKWNHEAFYHPDHSRSGTHNVEYGHWFQQDVYQFDAPFFNISESEATTMDPQQRMLLECSYEALENSGIPMSKVIKSDTSVFTACFATDYTDMLWRDPETVPMYQCTNAGHSRSNMANRISYSFDLRGPSVTADTACSGGLTALHLACQSLLTGDASQAIAAGSSMILGPELMMTMSMMRFLSPDGRCYTFDERANGYARGEGAAVLVLKRLDDAMADGDTIRAIIRGTGCNQDGKTPGITMPSGESQRQLMRSVYEKTGLDPLETSYVECHGTGTQAGDCTETAAINSVFCSGRPLNKPLAIGSVKTNVGHLEAASGLTGVIKSILMLENEVVLPNRNFEKPNPQIPLEEWALHVPIAIEPWTSSGPRRASVNSFGYGGTNVHAILESAKDFMAARGVDYGSLSQKSALAVSAVQEADTPRPLDGITTNGNGHTNGLTNGNGITTRNVTINGNVAVNGNGIMQDQGLTNGNGVLKSNGVAKTNGFSKVNGVLNGEITQNGSSTKTNGHKATLDSPYADDVKTNASALTSSGGGSNAEPAARIFALSAFDPTAGETWSRRLAEYLSQREASTDMDYLTRLAFTLSDRRTVHPWKATICASSRQDLVSKLEKLKFVNVPTRSRLGFVFTGQGAQWCGMGKELIDNCPRFRQTLEACGQALERNGADFSVLDELQQDFETSQVNKALYSQPLCTALQIALVDTLESWNIRPESVTGHSSGEIAAAYAAGAISLEDAMLIAYARGCASSKLTEDGVKGAMTAVGMGRQEVKLILDELKNGKATIACSNSPMSTTVSGDKSALDELQQVLRKKGVYNRRLVVEVAYHSHHMALVADSYRDAISHIRILKGNGVKFFSSVTGKNMETSKLGPEYWVSNLVGEVKFAQSLLQLSSYDSHDSSSQIQRLVEIGPHAALGGPIKQILDSSELLSGMSIDYLSALVRKKSAVDTVLDLASNLFVSGYPVQLSAINGTQGKKMAPLIDLPPYAWNHHKSYSAESRISKAYRERRFPRLDLIGAYDIHSSPLEPRWRQTIRLSELPWVRDHKIQGSFLYPAAGYITMAIEAAIQKHSVRAPDAHILGYQFRDVSISSALVISDAPGEVEVFITLRAFSESVRVTSTLWDEFSVTSVTNESHWTEHCRGLIAVQTQSKTSNPVNGLTQEKGNSDARSKIVEELETACQISHDAGVFYDHLSEIGMEYGPTFSNIRSARSAPGKCITTVEVPDTAASMPMHFEQAASVIHPGTLDSIFQTYLLAQTGKEGKLGNAIIPVSIEDMFITHDITRRSGDKLTSYTSISRIDYRHKSTGILVFEDDYADGKRPVIQLNEMTVAVIDHPESDESEQEEYRRAFNMKWAPDVDSLTEQQLVNICSSPVVAQDSVADAELNQTAARLLRATLSQVSGQQAMEAGDYAHDLWKLISRQLQELSPPLREGTGENASLSGKVDGALEQAAERLSNFLSGRTKPTDLIKEYDMKTVTNVPHIFDENQILAAYLSLLAHKTPALSVLTMGSLSGPASLNLLSLLSTVDRGIAPFKALHHTDTELNMDQVATSEFPAWAESLTLKEGQTEAGIYDAVVAFNVGGSSDHLEKFLLSAATLLKDGGRLLLARLPVESPAVTLVWGPVANLTRKQNELASWLPHATVEDVARKVGFEMQAKIAEGVMILRKSEPAILNKKNADVLIVGGEEQTAVDVLALGEALGSKLELVPLEGACPKPGQTCIVLSELARSVLAEPTPAEWDAVKNMARGDAGLVWVTRGAGGDTCSDPKAALAHGLARTIRAERGDQPVVTLDLDGSNPLDCSTAAKCIADVVGRVVRRASVDGMSADLDVELMEKGGIVYVPRLVEDTDASAELQENRTTTNPNPNTTTHNAGAAQPQQWGQMGPSRLFAGTPGLLDTLHFARDERAEGCLPAGHVEVDVKAAGINFKDVMMAMGQIKVEDLGCECSGIVSAIGDAIAIDAQGLRVGDRVMCLSSGSYCTKLRVDAQLAHRIPVSMSFETAAALPITHVTAYHSVHNIARLRKDETVLIHAAAGGLGQALVELSQLAGAIIYVTVGSVDKKRFIMERYGLPEEHILFSRDVSFARDIMRLTQNRGVDAVMNCLAGEALRQSWMCIAPYGRFVELGQRDITINTRLDMAPFARNASFTAYNLAYTMHSDPGAAREVMASVLALFSSGSLKGPDSVETYAFSQLEKAFRKMQTGRHIGKLVAVAQPDDVVDYRYTANSSLLFRPDAAYLLVGGLGGIGRATALWMASRGARHVIFINRSGTQSEAARDTVSALQAAGCNATVLGCDIADQAQLASTLAAAHELPPIRGVIQGAMVLRDTMLANMTIEDYSSVLRPKLQGTLNLHAHLPADMDFFVMESSISGIVGNTTQAAYAAANTFLDAFARFRRSSGLPATTIDIGAVSDIGYLAQNDELKQAMERQGFEFTDQARLMRLLEFAIMKSTREPSQSHIVTGLGAWHPDNSLQVLHGPAFSRYRMLSPRATATSSNAQDTLRVALKQSADINAAAQIVLTAVIGQIVARTGIPVENVSTSKSLQDYGIDSLSAVELRNWLSKEMESVVPIFELLAAESLTAVAALIARRSRLITSSTGGVGIVNPTPASI